MSNSEFPRYFSRVWHVSLDFPVLDSCFSYTNLLQSAPSLLLILRGEAGHAARGRSLCDKLSFKPGGSSSIEPSTHAICDSDSDSVFVSISASDSLDKWPKLRQWTAKLAVYPPHPPVGNMQLFVPLSNKS